MDKKLEPIFDPLRDVENTFRQADEYVNGCAHDVMALTDKLALAKGLLKAARIERESARRAVYVLKQAGYGRG